MPLTATEAAYLAGIVDGEGCIRFNNAPRLMVANTNKKLIDWLIERIGGYYCTYREDDPINKTVYQWEVSARKCEAVLREIRPYMILKAAQADEIFAYYAQGVDKHHKANREPYRSNLAAMNKKGRQVAAA